MLELNIIWRACQVEQGKEKWRGTNSVCELNIELLLVITWPYYLPQEFSQAIVMAKNIHHSDNTDAACCIVHSVTSVTLGPSCSSHNFNPASLSSVPATCQM